MANKCKCGRDVTGQTHQADPAGNVICQVCDHILSRPKPFDTITELFDDVIKNNAPGVAFRESLEISYPVLLQKVNAAISERWMQRLIKLNEQMAGGSNENV